MTIIFFIFNLMKKYLLPLFLFISISLLAQQTKPGRQPYKIIAYYTGNGTNIKQYPVNKLTHIIYSFLKIQNDTLTFRDSAQENNVQQLVALKATNPQLKSWYLLVVGAVALFAAIFLQTMSTEKLLQKLLLYFLKSMVLMG